MTRIERIGRRGITGPSPIPSAQRALPLRRVDARDDDDRPDGQPPRREPAPRPRAAGSEHLDVEA